MPSDSPPRGPGFWRELTGFATLGRDAWALLSTHEKRLFCLAWLLILITAAATNAVPVLLGQMVDAIQARRDHGSISQPWVGIALFYLALIGGAVLLRETFQAGSKYVVRVACARIDRDLSVGLVAHLFRENLLTLSKEQVGSLHGRAMRSVDGFIQFLKVAFKDFFPATLSVATALAYAFYRQPLLGLAMLAAIPTTLLIASRQLTVQKPLHLDMLRAHERLDGLVVEQLEGIEYIRAANTYDLEMDRVRGVANQRRDRELRLDFFNLVFDVCKGINDWGFQLAVLGLAIYLAVIGWIRVGDIIAFSFLYSNMITPLRDVYHILDDSYESGLQMKDLAVTLGEVLDPSFRLDPHDEPTIIRTFGALHPLPPAAEFSEPTLSPSVPVFVADRLTVDYPLGDGRCCRALAGVSLEIRPNEMLGLAGPSGSGKSTLVKVLLRLTHPTSGSATLGGVPIQSISRQTIGRLVGYVGQSPFLFAGTISENIAYGCNIADAERIRQAAEQAGIHDEIMALADGYQAWVQERGQNLSGGQRQRIALARVFLKDPPLLVLDEGTSALDNISERHVQQAIEKLRAGRTVILVAHRLSTLQTVDRVLVFQNGRIVQTGTVDELTSRQGMFTEMLRMDRIESSAAVPR